MAYKLTLPNAGQPIDATFIDSIVKAINSLVDDIPTTSSSHITSVDTTLAGKVSMATSNACIIAGYVEVKNNGGTNSVTYDFPPNFKYPPIVTATPITVAGLDSGSSVSVLVNSVSLNNTKLTVTFNGSGTYTVGLNLIIVGVPV